MDPKVDQPLRQLMQCMLTCTDDLTGQVVAMLKEKEMWDNSLMVWSADNGGPQYWAANNYPLKGSKTTNWQGGIRVNAFVSGGLLKTAAPDMIGRKLDGFVHVCDWCAA